MIATTRDGRELYYERHGAGTPIVVFEAGMGFSRNSWGAVIPGVCEHTTVIAYDRSGVGRSAPDPAPRNLDRLAEDLVDLLDHLGDGPYVLVGHRWGGPIIRVTAAQRPQRIAGLVLVDPTDERCDVFFSKGSERQQRWAPSVMRALAYTRILRLMVRAESKVLSEPWRTGLRKEDGTVASVREQLAELASSTGDLRGLRAEPPNWPDVSVTLISGGKPGFMDRGRRDELVATHRTTVRRLPHGHHVVAERSSHDVVFTEPGLIVDEILRITHPAPADS